jgi:predicted RNA-binding Zn ribbon-like protein
MAAMSVTFRTGSGAVWLDFLSTLEGRHRDQLLDQVGTPEDLQAWLDQAGLRPDAPTTEADVATAAELREALHRVTLSVIDGARPRRSDVAILDAVLAVERPLRVAPAPGSVRINGPATVTEALARLTRDAVQLLGGPRRSSLRTCGDNTCAGVFLDDTRRRRWCTDERCGNRVRVRAHRERIRASAGSGTTSRPSAP